MHSIRSRIIFITITAILTSIFAFSGIVYFNVRHEVNTSSVEKLGLISENVQESLNSYLDDVEHSVDLVSRFSIDSLDNLVLVENGVIGLPAGSTQTALQQYTFEQYLESYTAEVESIFRSVANHTSGVVSFYYCISPEMSDEVHGFFRSRYGKMDFEEREPIDVSLLDAADTLHDGWYFTTTDRARPSWIGPYPSRYTEDALTISYIAPVYKAGRLVGVVGMDVLFDTLISRIRQQRVYQTGYAWLLDEQGHILWHPSLEIGSLPEDAGTTLYAQTFLSENSGDRLIRYNYQGQQRQLAFTTLSNGMKLAVCAPVAEITTSWRQMSGILVGAAILILGAFTVLTLFVVDALTRPLRSLAEAATRLSAGDYDVELDYEGNDEVGVLTGSFRQMQNHLKLYISDLNNRAYSDALTSVKNKRAYDIFAGRLNDQIEACRADADLGQAAFAVVMFDCNSLKEINDLYGHEKGDIYLRTSCALICRVYAHSPVFRMGGDEFATILQKRDYEIRDALLQDFDRMAAEVNAAAANPWERVNIAKGMAVFLPGEDPDIAAVLSRADALMYDNKKRMKTGAPGDD